MKIFFPGYPASCKQRHCFPRCIERGCLFRRIILFFRNKPCISFDSYEVREEIEEEFKGDITHVSQIHNLLEGDVWAKCVEWEKKNPDVKGPEAQRKFRQILKDTCTFYEMICRCVQYFHYPSRKIFPFYGKGRRDPRISAFWPPSWKDEKDTTFREIFSFQEEEIVLPEKFSMPKTPILPLNLGNKVKESGEFPSLGSPQKKDALSLQQSSISFDFVGFEEKTPQVRPAMSMPFAPMPMKFPEVFLGTMVVSEEEVKPELRQETPKEEERSENTEERISRSIYPRTLFSPFKALLVYESGLKTITTVTFTKGRKFVVLEPQDKSLAYFIIGVEDLPEDGAPILLKADRYKKIIHSKNNDAMIREIVEGAVVVNK